MTKQTANAVAKYSKLTCLALYQRNQDGDGARTLAFEYGMTTRQADAAINAGRELSGLCRWFLNCNAPSTGTTSHPVLGDVPTCDRCAKFARG